MVRIGSEVIIKSGFRAGFKGVVVNVIDPVNAIDVEIPDTDDQSCYGLDQLEVKETRVFKLTVANYNGEVIESITTCGLTNRGVEKLLQMINHAMGLNT